MIITFPRFGYTAEVVSLLFDALGIKYVKPPVNDINILKKGSEISPEEICLPFKYMAGNFMETYEAGADTAVMIATAGPCRLGEYGELLKEVLDNAGYRYKWVILDAPSVIGINEFIKRVEGLAEKKNKNSEIIKNAFLTVKLIRRLDLLEERMRKLNGYTDPPCICLKLLKEMENSIGKMKDFKAAFDYTGNMRRRISELKINKHADPVKILIVGEIYTSIEKDANGRLEEKLMKLGCSVERHMNISWWMKNTVKQSIIPKNMNLGNIKRNEFTCNIGGYGKDTINKIISSKHVDGIIKILPSGCMPEIVTKAYCEKLQEDMDIRILHLLYDEMKGEAGYETRIEAFVDMLERRKYVLAGSRHWFHKHRSGFDQ